MKSTLFVLACTASILALASCGGGGSDSSVEEEIIEEVEEAVEEEVEDAVEEEVEEAVDDIVETTPVPTITTDSANFEETAKVTIADREHTIVEKPSFIGGAYIYDGRPTAFYTQFNYNSSDVDLNIPAATENNAIAWTWVGIYNQIVIATDGAVTYEEYSNGVIEYDSSTGVWQASLSDGAVNLTGTLDGTGVSGTFITDGLAEGVFEGGFIGTDAIDADGNPITAGSFAGETADQEAVLSGVWGSDEDSTYSDEDSTSPE